MHNVTNPHSSSRKWESVMWAELCLFCGCFSLHTSFFLISVFSTLPSSVLWFFEDVYYWKGLFFYTSISFWFFEDVILLKRIEDRFCMDSCKIELGQSLNAMKNRLKMGAHRAALPEYLSNYRSKVQQIWLICAKLARIDFKQIILKF